VLTVAPSFKFKLQEGVRYLINPGSVGPAARRNPLCSFAIYDSDTPRRHDPPAAVQAEAGAAQDRGRRAPPPLADRLALGALRPSDQQREPGLAQQPPHESHRQPATFRGEPARRG
jgi:hypothetical protein